jgi:hypothetical protein
MQIAGQRAKLQLRDFQPCIQGLMKRTATRLIFSCVLLFFVTQSEVTQSGVTQSEAQEKSQRDRVQAEMHNVMYHFSPAIAVHILQLEGDLAPTKAHSTPVFDDAKSFTIIIRSAKISVTTDALSNVLNQYALASPDSPIKSVRVSAQDGKLKVRGRLHSKGDVAFESEGTLSVTPQGEIRVHTDKIKAGHLPVKGLLDLLGKNLAQMIDTRKVRGLRMEKDDMVLTPSQLFPPPHIRGQLSSISIVGNEIVLQYENDSANWARIPGNYMAYRGGQLRFGKLTMSNADLILIDMNPQDAMDFYLDHYKDQLVAGYTKITPEFGLRSYVRDYNKIPTKHRAGAQQ